MTAASEKTADRAAPAPINRERMTVYGNTHIKVFLMAAREENITKAASLLHITQPTLSRQLMQLEEELGVTLFTRSNHRIILTDDGMLLKRRAQELVSLAERQRWNFSMMRIPWQGRLPLAAARHAA